MPEWFGPIWAGLMVLAIVAVGALLGYSVVLLMRRRALLSVNRPDSSEDYLFSIVDGIQSKAGAAGYESLAPHESVFYRIWSLEAEVNDGGFEQFYRNSSGDMAAEVPAALDAIGATHTASIVGQANATFGPDGPPAVRETRTAAIASFDDSLLARLADLDAAFLEYEEDLSGLLARYMRKRM